MTKLEDNSRRRLLTWLWRLPVIAAVLGLGGAALQAYRVHFGKREPAAEADFAPVKPQGVAQLSRFDEVWAGVDFELDGMPAVAIRLPEPVPGGLSVGEQHFAAYGRICTHLGCTVVYRRDTEAVAFAFNYRSEEPSLACPCHLGVFAPSQAGKAVSGPPIKPLLRVKLRLEDDMLYAVGLERRGVE